MVSTPAKRSRRAPKKSKAKVTLSTPNFPGFPKQLSVTMRYVQRLNVNTTAGSAIPTTEQLSVNGLFAPKSAGGHQPMQFDALSSLYNNYTVIGSRLKVQVTCSSISGTANSVVTAGVYVEDNTTITPATTEAMCEQSTAKYVQLNAVTEGTSKTFYTSWSAKGTFGGNIRDNDDLGGTGAANPVLQQQYTFFAGSEAAAVALSVRFLATIEYMVVWDNLINQAAN